MSKVWTPSGGSGEIPLSEYVHDPAEEPTTAHLGKLIEIQQLFDNPDDYYEFIMDNEETADIATMSSTFMDAVMDDRSGVSGGNDE